MRRRWMRLLTGLAAGAGAGQLSAALVSANALNFADGDQANANQSNRFVGVNRGAGRRGARQSNAAGQLNLGLVNANALNFAGGDQTNSNQSNGFAGVNKGAGRGSARPA